MEVNGQTNGKKKKIEVVEAPLRVKLTDAEAQEAQKAEAAVLSIKLTMADAAAEVMAAEDALEAAKKKLRRTQENTMEGINVFRTQIKAFGKAHGLNPDDDSWVYVNQTAEFVRK